MGFIKITGKHCCEIVNASNIRSIYYNSETKSIIVYFSNGDRTIYDNFENPKDAAKYFNTLVKELYQ